MVKLAELREAKGYSQRDFALLLGVSHGMVGMVETGRRFLTGDQRMRAIRALGITTAEELRKVPELSPDTLDDGAVSA